MARSVGPSPPHLPGRSPLMGEQDRYIPGVPCWVDTAHPDPEAATAFYGGLFGWTFEDVAPADGPVRYFMARRPGGDVGAIRGPPPGPARPPRRRGPPRRGRRR